MPIYEIGQFLSPNLDSIQIVNLAFNRLKNRENRTEEELLMAVYCIDTYGTDEDRETLRNALEAQPLEEEVLEYRMAA
jgi:hypothetical protein